MRRGESLFEAMPDSRALVDEGVVREGSLLSGVSAQCGWEGEQANETPSRQQEAELCQTIPLNRVHLKFNMEALQLLPLTIRYEQVAKEGQLSMSEVCTLHAGAD